ncbi:hypothetical protein WH96_17755 [Kiloniella spongiae]|uniref:DUF805 domain-containing protein n=1 Tax=Kiloniella spongiae TaxID=1489064 RepID=A0A0H2MAY5_9PROT|nr:DUF805 domain-containing protein [Kiloniella spongiae]KLN59346.1 hypothetical protein WH96_17755 [Kiloniella spongiae]
MIGIFAIVSVVFLLPTIIYVSSDEKVLGRLTYVFRMLFLSLFLWAFLVMSFTHVIPVEGVLKVLKNPTDDIQIEGAWTVLSVVLIILCTQICWMVHRLNHIGWPKWLALLITVPAVNLIFSFLLTTMPGRRIERDYSEILERPMDVSDL